jgi:hypothetical protein
LGSEPEGEKTPDVLDMGPARRNTQPLSFTMPASHPARNRSHIARYQRLQRGPYYADFRRDKRLVPEVYHCIIQRKGSSEILRWTQHHSLEDAVSVAEAELRRLASGQEAAAKKIRLHAG